MALATDLDAEMDRASEPVIDSGDAHTQATEGEQTASSSASASASLNAAPKRQSSLLAQIDDLRKEQARLRQQRKDAARSLKLAVRKKKRIQKRAGQLTDADLMEVLRMRAEKAASDASMTTPPPSTQDDNED